MDKREFRKDGQNFMAHNLYRYRSLLKNPGDTRKLLACIRILHFQPSARPLSYLARTCV